jgi:hypothetical protein
MLSQIEKQLVDDEEAVHQVTVQEGDADKVCNANSVEEIDNLALARWDDDGGANHH